MSIRNRVISSSSPSLPVARRAFGGGVCANAPPSPGERLGYRPPAPRGESPYAQRQCACPSARAPRQPRSKRAARLPGRPAAVPTPRRPPRPTHARALNFRRNPVSRVRVSTTQYFPSLYSIITSLKISLPPPPPPRTRFCPSPRNHGHGRAWWTRSSRQ